VHHILRAVLGLVSVWVLIGCRALHHVSASLAIGAALRTFYTGTNAQVSVIKYVIKTIVTHVLVETTPE
jgi:hypothetical protein